MASVFLYHVVGDLTVGKPELREFPDTETVASAIRTIGDSSEGGITVWKKRSPKSAMENAEARQQRFVGILNAWDIVTFLAREDCLADQEKALNTPVSEVVIPNNSALQVVDPGTRLIDALEMMKLGAKRLLVPKSLVWRGMSKRFSILYNGKWLKNVDPLAGSSSNALLSANRLQQSSSSTSSIQDKFCCLSREDVLRFLINCLGAIAPLPLSSIASLGAINPNYCCIEASSPAIDAIKKVPRDPCAVAVVEQTLDDRHKILGEISSIKLWRCDYMAAAWALANLSAGQFVMGVEDKFYNTVGGSHQESSLIDGDTSSGDSGESPNRLRRFSSRSVGFFGNSSNPNFARSIYRGRSAPLTCKVTSSLAAVMAQMLSHRATHVWVTDEKDDLVGAVGYADILTVVTRQPATAISDNNAAS
ncbi:CBS domain-containing protein CBSX6 [Andrographis paniculata]|uniref:CBS domain-containing protein CBSX6 n=1 Tax=Andrographis paniculata TaxID=175694 RepID=UPI0021E8A366|nr:CBS domain-containing protein CBSX6 [Andrographis paniculata]XP_051121545.1 CBS domain-containing protein CBSX6 [Andrographis paniculata]